MKSPAFQFYPDDFLSGTMHFTDAEVGLYIRLLCVQWSVGSLPNDDSELSSFGRGRTTLVKLKNKFCVSESDGRLRNARLEQERAKQLAYRESRSQNGKLGGRPPKAQQNHMESIPFSETKAKKSLPSISPFTDVLLGKEPKEKKLKYVPEIPSNATPELQHALQNWLHYKAERKEKYVESGWNARLATLKKYSDSAIIAAIDSAMSNGYKGFFPENFDAVARNAQNSTPKPKLEKAPWE